MTDSFETPEFWIDLVETSLDLDWSEAFVPIQGLPAETAIALAERLSMEVEIDSSEYIFYKRESAKTQKTLSQVLH